MDIDTSATDKTGTEVPSIGIAIKRPVPVRFTVADHDGTIETREGKMEYHAGDYILTDHLNDGRSWPVDPHYFGLHYTVLIEGTAIPSRDTRELLGILRSVVSDLSAKRFSDPLSTKGGRDLAVAITNIETGVLWLAQAIGKGI